MLEKIGKAFYPDRLEASKSSESEASPINWVNFNCSMISRPSGLRCRQPKGSYRSMGDLSSSVSSRSFDSGSAEADFKPFIKLSFRSCSFDYLQIVWELSISSFLLVPSINLFLLSHFFVFDGLLTQCRLRTTHSVIPRQARHENVSAANL